MKKVLFGFVIARALRPKQSYRYFIEIASPPLAASAAGRGLAMTPNSNKVCCFLLSIVYCLLFTVTHSQTWNKVGTGVWGGAEALGIYKNELYFSGGYSQSPYINIAKWNGSAWTPVDSAVGFPYCFLEYNNELYVGGGFTNIHGAGPGIAKWTGTQWLSLGSGVGGNGKIKDMKIFNGEIYAAGEFWSIGGVNTKGIARWNGANWSAVGGGLSGGFPTSRGFALTYRNDLFVAGSFAMAGNVPANYVARWNGTAWDSLGSGTNSNVNAMVVDTINNFLYMGGIFIYAGGTNAWSVARWDGFELHSVGKCFGPGKTCMEMYHGQLYVGDYGGLGGTADTFLIRWDGEQWHHVIAPNSTVLALQVYKDELYVGGGFDTIGNNRIMGIARYSAPWDSSCKFFQPIIKSMRSLTAPNGVSDTFYYTDSVAVQFYNNITSASSWQWDFGDGDTGSGKTPIHYYKAAGTYTVSVIVNYPYGPKGPCIDTAYKTITVIYGISGVNELQENVKFKVYPNPAKNNILIEASDDNKYIIYITNPLGQQIAKKPFQKKLEVDVSSFGKGLFLIEVCDEKGGKCHTEKVVIE